MEPPLLKGHRLTLLTIVTVAAYDTNRLSRTVDSVINFSGDIEHLIVIPKQDNPSFDYLQTKIGISRNSLRVFQDNAVGIYPAMNIGILEAKGEYICFWNAGDLLYNEQELAIFLGYLRRLSPLWSISSAMFDWDVTQIPNQRNLDAFLNQERESFISHQTIFARRDTLISLNKFDIRLSVAADLDMTYRLATLSNPAFIDRKTVRVELPKYSVQFNRKARWETLVVILRSRKQDKVIAIRNFFYREISNLSRGKS